MRKYIKTRMSRAGRIVIQSGPDCSPDLHPKQSRPQAALLSEDVPIARGRDSRQPSDQADYKPTGTGYL